MIDWLPCWVFVSVLGLSLVAASGGHSSSRCAGPSLSRPLLLRSTGSRCAGSVVVAHGPSCSAACGIFPDQGSNPCPLHWQADSQPLHHQGSPCFLFNKEEIIIYYGKIQHSCSVENRMFIFFLLEVNSRPLFFFFTFYDTFVSCYMKFKCWECYTCGHQSLGLKNWLPAK